MYLQWNDVSVSPNFPTTSRRLYDNSPAYLLHFLGHAFRTRYSYFRVTCSEGGDQRLFNASGTLVVRLGVRRPQARGAQTYWRCYHCTNQPRICREQSTFISLESNSPGFSLTSIDCQRSQHQTIRLRPIYFWKRPFATVKFSTSKKISPTRSFVVTRYNYNIAVCKWRRRSRRLLLQSWMSGECVWLWGAAAIALISWVVYRTLTCNYYMRWSMCYLSYILFAILWTWLMLVAKSHKSAKRWCGLYTLP